MEDMDPYGGLSMEQLQQLQQLEQLRMQDPAAFEEMMKSMYGWNIILYYLYLAILWLSCYFTI